MALKQITETVLVYKCNNCEVENNILLTDLIIYPAQGSNKLILKIPTCICGSNTFLTTGEAAPYKDSHHLVKCLMARVIDAGQLAPGADAGVVGTLRAALTSAYSAKGNQILIKELSGELKLDRAPVDLTY